MLSFFFFLNMIWCNRFSKHLYATTHGIKGGPNFSLAPQARCLRVNLGIRLSFMELDRTRPEKWAPWYTLIHFGEAQNSIWVTLKSKKVDI